MKISKWQICIICSYLLLILFFILIRVFFLKFFLQILFEDRYVEWAQFYFLVLTSLLCFKLTWDKWIKDKRINYFYILFGIFCMLVAFDEISWGQRILDFKSPQFFIKYNAQKETEFHNIIGHHLINKVIDYSYLIGLMGIIYGVVLPIAFSFSKRIAAIFQRFNLVVPPKILITGFLSGALFMGLSNIALIEEIGEFFIYLSFFYFLLIKWYEQKKNKTDNKEQFSFSWILFKISIFILCLAVFSTFITDMHGRYYGPGVIAKYLAYTNAYAYYGFYNEAIEQYENALGIKNNYQDYSFLKNLNNADIKIPSSVRTSISILDIYGDFRISLFAHPRSDITYKLTLPERPLLTFGIGLDSKSWGADKGDGVLFEIYVRDGSVRERVFSKYIDPKNKSEDRKWHDEVVDLSKYGGKVVSLSFVTTPGPNNNPDYDWAGWSNPKLITVK
ncbi:MAG: hypothetical protein ACREOW_08915 [Thermodesulfobacteriota bacterium]